MSDDARWLERQHQRLRYVCVRCVYVDHLDHVLESEISVDRQASRSIEPAEYETDHVLPASRYFSRVLLVGNPSKILTEYIGSHYVVHRGGKSSHGIRPVVYSFMKKSLAWKRKA